VGYVLIVLGWASRVLMAGRFACRLGGLHSGTLPGILRTLVREVRRWWRLIPSRLDSNGRDRRGRAGGRLWVGTRRGRCWSSARVRASRFHRRRREGVRRKCWRWRRRCRRLRLIGP